MSDQKIGAVEPGAFAQPAGVEKTAEAKAQEAKLDEQTKKAFADADAKAGVTPAVVAPPVPEEAKF